MNGYLKTACLSVMLTALSSHGVPEELILEASKDSFARGNDRIRNSGASEYLLLLSMPHVKSMVAFDFSGITNEIVSAEFQFQQHNSVADPINLVIAPMVNTENNAGWVEGKGAFGNKGQYAQPGESCYLWRASPDALWESASGSTLEGMGDSKLWKSAVATLNHLEWAEGTLVKVPVIDIAFLEEVRESETPIVTFGLWGTAGNGFYQISSKESGKTPVLILTLKEDEESKE